VVISPSALARIEAETARYPQRRGALLPALHVLQEEAGYVDAEVAIELAELFAMPPAEVMEVVSFYSLFHTTPQPRHHVFVCTNLSCSLRGARGLLRDLAVHLRVDEEGNTPDGRVHLGREECLGACAGAPMMRVDGAYHENLDLDTARRVVDALA
jgi:NADH:ubiquinone oxidoreductase subunit E